MLAHIFSTLASGINTRIDLDNTDLSIDELEAENLMNKFFEKLNVERGSFRIEAYFPNHPFHGIRSENGAQYPSQISLSSMLIRSAKAGKWLYDYCNELNKWLYQYPSFER